MISYQKLHISACWKTSLKSQEIWQHWAHVPTWELLLGAKKQLPPLHGTQGTCSPGLQKIQGSEAWASQPDHQGSLIYDISLYDLGQINAMPQFPHL